MVTRKKSSIQTRDDLIAAATAEFELVGYWDTNSNKIARRAGYSPQMFYRHFADKSAIFLAVYEQWAAEVGDIVDVATAGQAASALLDHHRRFRLFRRALRQLALTDAALARARDDSRRRQVGALARRFPRLGALGPEALALRLLMVERICDAAADGELAGLGIDPPEVAIAAALELAYGLA